MLYSARCDYILFTAMFFTIFLLTFCKIGTNIAKVM